MTDHYTDELFKSCASANDFVLNFRASRLLIDVERFQNDAEEPMSSRGMGMIYTRTHDQRRLRENTKSKRRLFSEYYLPHHARLEQLTNLVLANSPKVLIIDCHSYPSRALPYEINQTGSRPEICIGRDNFHTPQGLAQELYSCFKTKGYTVDYDTPFSGSIVPLSFFHKDVRVKSIMIEIRRDVYMDELSGRKNDRFKDLERDIREILLEIRS